MAEPQALDAQPSELDLELQELVMEAIDDDNIVRESDVPVTVTVLDGIAAVSGVVLSKTMHDRVLYAAARTRGVKKVIDNLISDPEIENAIAQLLSSIPNLKTYTVKVTSYMGQVTLYGGVASDEQHEEALALAASVPGVVSVNDRLQIGPVVEG